MIRVACRSQIDNTFRMRTQVGLSVIGGILFLLASCSGIDAQNQGTGGTGTGGTAGSGASTGKGGSAGGLSCATGQTACGPVCKNLMTDFSNCGTCGTVCGAGQSCSAGTCACTAGLTACGTACVNTVSDPANCGTCGTVCTAGTVCSQGACAAGCAAGETQCGQSCTNSMTDPTNCGFCGNMCGGGQSCVSGACTCPAGQTTCGGVCVDTLTTLQHCGGCNMMCAAGQTCSSGVCVGGNAGGAGGGAGASGAAGTAGAGGASGAAGTAGTAGGGGTGGTPPEGRNGCAIAPGMIADFEEGAGDPVLIAHEDRNGEWETFNDGSSTNQMMKVESSGGTAMCDNWALHVTGSNYGTWGAGFGFSLVGPKTAPVVYNATQKQFTAIRFKAKLGTGADPKSPVRFNISTPWTESIENPGGQCQPRAATTTKAATDCYQHAGRFLPVGAGTGELTQTWKEFTYCFDRDLYPLSLPSNLTTEQRNNIASSMLKVQFQFNQGKDYSGGYPANAQYPIFAKGLPFDFWLDDIEFLSGECPNMATSTNNGSPTKPFPQNAAVGTCAPATNAAKFATPIIEAYQRWTRHFVQNDRIVAPEQQNAITSEAMGYGMMIAASMGDKAAFDKFHGYVKSQGGTGSGLMTWKNGGSGSASDGDIDIAFALLMAHAQWPSGGYKTAADSMAAAILSQDIVSNIIRGGSQFQSAPFNPSYFSPAALRRFGSSFSAAVTANYNLVTANVSAGTAGIPTDWANPSSGAPSGPGSAQVTSEITDGENGAMGYDAARVPWRLAMDVCTGGNAGSTLTSIVNYFAAKYDMGASIDLMKAGWYKKSPGDPHPMAKDVQGSYIGPAGAGAMATGNAVMRDRAFRTMLDILENGDFNHTYFPSTVGLLTLLMMSGNFPIP
jgi:endo-1,4-beta-D-glucanase Y